MIARLRGLLLERGGEEVVVDVGGVGYQVFVSAQTLAALAAEGAEVELFIVTHVREDALQLYGFAESIERTLFSLLQSVSGIGPRLAMKILSAIAAPDLCAAIRRRDVVRLMAIDGIGKKTAERLSIELADRLPPVIESSPRVRQERDGDEVAARAVSALVNLQFRPAEAERAVEAAMNAGCKTLEEVVREALRSTRR